MRSLRKLCLIPALALAVSLILQTPARAVDPTITCPPTKPFPCYCGEDFIGCFKTETSCLFCP